MKAEESLRALHKMFTGGECPICADGSPYPCKCANSKFCGRCEQDWPCETAAVLAELAALRVENERLRRACEATILFHSGGAWDDKARLAWFNATQHDEATTRILCDVARAALRGEG